MTADFAAECHNPHSVRASYVLTTAAAAGGDRSRNRRLERASMCKTRLVLHEWWAR